MKPNKNDRLLGHAAKEDSIKLSLIILIWQEDMALVLIRTEFWIIHPFFGDVFNNSTIRSQITVTAKKKKKKRFISPHPSWQTERQNVYFISLPGDPSSPRDFVLSTRTPKKALCALYCSRLNRLNSVITILPFPSAWCRYASNDKNKVFFFVLSFCFFFFFVFLFFFGGVFFAYLDLGALRNVDNPHLLTLLAGTLSPRVVVPVRIPCLTQIELFMFRIIIIIISYLKPCSCVKIIYIT